MRGFIAFVVLGLAVATGVACDHASAPPSPPALPPAPPPVPAPPAPPPVPAVVAPPPRPVASTVAAAPAPPTPRPPAGAMEVPNPGNGPCPAGYGNQGMLSTCNKSCTKPRDCTAPFTCESLAGDPPHNCVDVKHTHMRGQP